MKKVYNYLYNEIKLKTDDIIVVGCSGGPDSMALLHVLESIRKKINIKIVCAHVNHNVRKESIDEQKFMDEWCINHNIIFETMTIEEYGDDNFENEARTIRYHFFENLIKKYNANYLMTAHHGDDLMETVLMRIVRGSTLRGYSGFSQKVDYDNYSLVRPLVFYTKDEIIDYDKKYNIPFVIDKTNYEDIHTRNRYRKHVLPFLKSEDNNVHEKFLKFNKLIEKYDNFINREVDKYYNDVFNNYELNLTKYLKLDKLIQEKIIYLIMESIYNDDLMLIYDRHVQLIMDLINSKKQNTFIYLPNNIKVVKEYAILRFIDEENQVDNYEIELIDSAVLPNGKHLVIVDECDTNGNDICRLSFDDVKFPLYIRTRRHGDKMILKGLNRHKKIKDIFIDCKVPLSERELWPVIVDSNNEVIWLPGLKKSKFNKLKNEKCDIIIKYY